MAMKKSNVFIADRAPKFLRNLLTGLAEQVDPETLEHPYLNPGAPRWMHLKLMDLYTQCAQIRKNCVAEYGRKRVTWLFQLTGNNFARNPGDLKQQQSDCESWESSGYELANGYWNARLQISPGTTRQQAIALAEEFIKTLTYMTNDEYDKFLSPVSSPWINASINTRDNYDSFYENMPF